MKSCDTKLKDTLQSHTCKRQIKWNFEIKVAIYEY
jgi:hypothetical protein